MSKKKKKNSVKNKIRNPYQQIALLKTGSGPHKDKRLKRKRKDDWKKEEY